MRLATVAFLAAVPAYALAQPKPTHEHRATHHAPAAHRAAKHVPAAHKPAEHRHGPVPAKPASVTPVPVKPARPKPPAPPAPDPHKGSVTGEPLPRFASLKTDDVNFRRGPGMRYPIEWVYKRRGLPVEVEREFEVWRLVVDPQGTKGWVHTVTITSRRTGIVTGAEDTLRSAPSDTASAVAKLQRGVIVRLRRCAATSEWCQVEVGAYGGFLRRNAMWGVLPGEAVP